MAGEYVAGGRPLAAGRGWDWIVAAWGLFKRQPAKWIALLVVLVLVALLLLLLHPIVGRLLIIGLGPIFAGGIVIGCRALDEGRALEFGRVIAGVRERLRPLAAIGAASAAATFIIALATVLASGANPFATRTAEELAAMPPAALLAIVLALLIILGLLVPVAMAAWFAPPLVLFHRMGVVEAIKESFAACLRNLVPFLVYGVILVGLGIAATLPFLLGWLVLFPVLGISIYTSYKDIFIAP